VKSRFFADDWLALKLRRPCDNILHQSLKIFAVALSIGALELLLADGAVPDDLPAL